jgi:hypothetical protein
MKKYRKLARDAAFLIEFEISSWRNHHRNVCLDQLGHRGGTYYVVWSWRLGASTDYSLEYLCNLNHDVNRVLRKGLYADALSMHIEPEVVL